MNVAVVMEQYSEWHDYLTHLQHNVTFCRVVNMLDEALTTAIQIAIQLNNTILLASSFHLTHISLSFTVISFTPIFMLFDL